MTASDKNLRGIVAIVLSQAAFLLSDTLVVAAPAAIDPQQGDKR
jgi:hypothetical protein